MSVRIWGVNGMVEKSEKKAGIVHLVGAGCGDYDLISLRGLRLLQNCDCVIYDSLIDSRLLEFVTENCEKICVGKRFGKHSEKQENINNMLVEKACEGKIVVRLKGGDPFVFGRGGEEIIKLKKYKIPYTIVPGISSSVAVPELAGIPVTHRKIARKFTVMTGHTADDSESVYQNLNLEKTGTLVCLMGLNNLENICNELINSGNSSLTPVAVISDGASSRQKIIRGNLSDIVQKSVQNKMKSPAVIVFGKTADFDFLPEKKDGALCCSVAVAGTKSFQDRLENALNIYGANVRRLNYVNINEYKNIPLFDEALSNIDKYKWIVFTSANGVDIFIKKLREKRFDLRKFSHIKFAVIGNATAKELEKSGIYPDLIPEKFTCGCLGKTLSECVKKDENILIVRAEKGSPLLTEILDTNNISFKDIHLYDLEYIPPDPENTLVDDDYVVFGSALGVKGFFECGYKLSEKTKVVSLGEVTSAKLKEYGIMDLIVSEKPDVNSIVKAIMEAEK